MRKVALIAGVFLFIVGPTLAQNLEVGVRGGPNYANFGSSDENLDDQYNRRTIFNAGVFFEGGLSNRFSLRPELIYTRRGAGLDEIEIRSDDGRAQGTFEDARYNFDYLQVPVLLKAEVLSSSSVQPLLYAGPSVSYLLSSTIEFRDPSTEGIEAFGGEENLESSTFNLEAVVGAGLMCELPSGNSVMVDVRYTRGFTDVLPEGSSTVRNQVLAVNVGFSFRL